MNNDTTIGLDLGNKKHKVVGLDGEKPREELEAREVLQHVEDARRCLRRLRVAEEREHEAAGEHHREEDFPAMCLQ